MDTPPNPTPTYVLGHDDEELRRLVKQAAFYEEMTLALFQRAGLAPGMRVLDFGCGVGDVSFLVAHLVGPEGTVIGVDRSPEALATARGRARHAGLDQVSFVQGDEHVLESLVQEQPFDAAVGRLVLMYQRDPRDIVARMVRLVRPGGIVAFQELNVHARFYAGEPFPLLEQVWDWALETCRRAGIELHMDKRLRELSGELGLEGVSLTQSGRLEGGSDSPGYEFLTGVIRSLMPFIVRFGVATAEEVEIDTLAARLGEEAVRLNLTFVPSFVVNACGRRPA